VRHGRQTLSVELEGGFVPGIVYRITLLPVVSDMFGNQLKDPFEIVFSTGGEFTPNALGGLAWDRLTGRGLAGLDVEAVGADSLVHVARTDADGIYVFRFLPPGRYQLVAYQDRNANGAPDPMEVQGDRGILIGGTSIDTLALDVAVMQPDTSPAVLTRARALDSVTVLAELDDYLDPSAPSSSLDVSIAREGGIAPAPERVFLEPEYVAWREAALDSLERLDSIDAVSAPAPADTVAVDTVAVQVRIPARRPPPEIADLAATTPGGGGLARPSLTRPGQEPGSPDGSPLPTRRVVVRLNGPLEPGVGYELTVAGVVNLWAVPGGGGRASLVWEPTRDSVPDTGTAAPPGGTGR
jgi:hypothetical protein